MESRVPATISQMESRVPATISQMESGVPATISQMESRVPATISQMESGVPATISQMESGVPATISQMESGVPATISQTVRESGLLSGQVQQAIQQMTSDPESFAEIASKAFAHAGPEMMEQAKKMAAGPEGQRLARELQGKGMTPAQAKRLRKQIKQVKLPGSEKESQKAVLIKATRVAKEIDIPCEEMEKEVSALLRCEKPVELNCSRLAAGPLAGKSVKVFYDPSISARNKRISRLVGFPLGGDIVVFCREGPVTLGEMEKMEEALLREKR